MIVVDKPISRIFAKIMENFRCKLHDVHEMQELIKLAIVRKYDIVKNILAERNFTFSLQIESQEERKMEKMKELNK